jgi:hypothetical protein
MLRPLDQQRRSAIQVLKARTKAAVAASIPSPAAPRWVKTQSTQAPRRNVQQVFGLLPMGGLSMRRNPTSVSALQHASVTTLPCEKQSNCIRWRQP